MAGKSGAAFLGGKEGKSDPAQDLVSGGKPARATRSPRRRPKRRGRPVGASMLTPDRSRTILAFIEAGAADYIAAEAAGIDERTFRDWMARGLGRRPTRRSTPELKAFARSVIQAKARARAAREIEAAEHHVTFWLSHMARSKPGREGWTRPIEEQDSVNRLVMPIYEPSTKELAETVRVLLEAGVLSLEDLTGTRLAQQDEGGAHG
jgi:hypothetical protein